VTFTSATTPASFGADRDWLLRFCPPGAATALAALFEIEQEISTSLKTGLEHAVAHTRLEWWAEELDRLARGIPRHPATRTLASSALERGATPPDLSAFIEQIRVDLACVAFLTREELDEYFGGWGRSIFRTAALIAIDPTYLTPAHTEARSAAERLASIAGPMVCEIERLRHFSRHARVGRIYVPLGDPPTPHAPWVALPLGEDERRALQSRRDVLCDALRQCASDTEPSSRPALRVPLLWMSIAMAPDRDEDAILAPVRRTISTWRDALAVSRGKLPSALI
jgi:phytoene synthase